MQFHFVMPKWSVKWFTILNANQQPLWFFCIIVSILILTSLWSVHVTCPLVGHLWLCSMSSWFLDQDSRHILYLGDAVLTKERKNTALKSFAWKWCISFWLAKPVMWLRLITIGGRVLSSQRKRVVNNWKHGNNTTVCKSCGWTSFYKFYIGF